MCGRYSLAVNPAQVAARFSVTESAATEPNTNVTPGSTVMAIATTREGDRVARPLRWGLVPGWAQDPKVGYKMINARAETVAEKSAYKRSFERYRCLIPADGFYELYRPESGPKQPFHIARPDGELFAFAGLWAVWHRGAPDELRTCTIITAAANRTMAEIHDRMPAILEPEAEAAWLDPAASAVDLLDLLHGPTDDGIVIAPVSPPAPPAQGALFA